MWAASYLMASEECTFGTAENISMPPTTALPASSMPEAKQPAADGSLLQQQQQTLKKEKKTPKILVPNAVPAASGDGLFYRAQLQVPVSGLGVLACVDASHSKLHCKWRS